MIRFTLRNPEGKYLNTDYHTNFANGEWRDEPRLYKSLSGIKSALGYWAPECVRSRIGFSPPNHGHRWTDEDLEMNARFCQEFRKIKQAEFFQLLEEAGYVLTKQEIQFE